MQAASPAPAMAADWTVDPAHTSVTFSVRHMMVTNVRGEMQVVAGSAVFDPKQPTKASIEVKLDPATINTRDAQRDGHLKSPDFFDVAKFPSITFASTKIEKAANGSYKIHGKLTMKGVTQAVVLEAEAPSAEIKDPWGNTKVGISATTVVKRQDFGINWNKTLDAGGVVVGDEVKITLDVELNKKGA